ncbi:hypothetical protein DCAR_0102363 [Daucus carota subsp. sativus]|uniref:Uncharacterized protein n=1 Tax=Daucus carota subsp. sativus TaxID=79200 RepID=A0AAF1AGQ6_DAUCS|nr:hypothetical protein DCAR_0102363 [Daucus carota subsp. sativus]
MDGDASENELQKLLDAIKSSEVVESRAQLITKLGNLDINEDAELISLWESLTVSNFTCLDISQCILNNNILHVAAKYLDSGISRGLHQYLGLGMKASTWCRKHLKMTLISTEDSQEEEHFSIFFKLLLDLLKLSDDSFSALARCPVSTSKAVLDIVEEFISEQLSLAKECLSEIKKIDPTIGSEVLKVVYTVLDAATRLCKVYCNSVNWDLYNERTEKTIDQADSKELNVADHTINITKCTIEKMCEVGILAGSDGGNLVNLLNLSWKGVVSLLQLGKGKLALKVNITDIIVSLINLANDSLRCAAQSWSCPSKEKVLLTEAKRIFLPVKFYLINAVRIISHYSSQAFMVYREIILSVIMISAFKISLSSEELLKSLAEAMIELLEPTSFHLLNSLLNSAQLGQEHKIQILEWLFSPITSLKNKLGDPHARSNHIDCNSMDAIFSVSCDAMPGARILSLGRIFLFLDLLKGSPDLDDDLRLGLSSKLKWLIDSITDKNIYSSILVLQIPVLYGSGQSLEFSYRPMFLSVIHALKAFMVVVSSTPVCTDVVVFLLENIVHPHFLCREIVMELLCFMVRHAETDMVNDIIDKLCSLLKVATTSESVLVPCSGLRILARSICVLLAHCSQSTVDLVYHSVIDSSRSKSSSMYAALLMEEFPINLLTDKVKSVAKEKIITEYFGFIERFANDSLGVGMSSVLYTPVSALSAALKSLQVRISDTDMKTLKLLVAVINKYRDSEGKVKDNYLQLLSEILEIISIMKHVYESDEMEGIVIELKNLFMSGQTVSDDKLSRCIPNLAVFMAGFSHIELAEDDDSSKSVAVWELYKMLLRERHWALVHLALKSFGYFASRTNCNQLWRFVPQDAALSFDIDSGKEVNEDRFMSELKRFLEKETAHLAFTPATDQLELLVEEAKLLLENMKMLHIKLEAIKCDQVEVDDGQPANKNRELPEAVECDQVEVDDGQHANKRRKLPDGIGKGVQLLKSGLETIGDGLSAWQQSDLQNRELHAKFATQVANLKDVIDHLVALSRCT